MNRKEFLNRSSLALGGLMTGSKIVFNKTKPKKMNELKITAPDLENICTACGTRYSENVYEKNHCPICLDERQYVKSFGQKWTSYSKLKRDHAVQVNQIRNDMYELRITPSFATGQRALLVTSTKGNVLWDCIPLLDKPTFEFFKSIGGLKAIAISHPHYYSLMVEWAKAFDCPIYLHSADKKWVMDKNQNIVYWDSETKKNLLPGVDIIHTGGHFPGSTVLHLHHKAKKSVLVGDTLYLSRDKKHLSAMFSYPNIIPLGKKELFSVFQSLEKLNFDCLYGAFQRQNLESVAKSVFKNSFEVYNKIYGNG